VEYKKIMTAGHEIPSNQVIRDFTTTVEEFLEKDSTRIIGWYNAICAEIDSFYQIMKFSRLDNSFFISGVHCTHGLNRTGYLICRYMVEKLGKFISSLVYVVL
jgi:atypical dual specificity phosphatase